LRRTFLTSAEMLEVPHYALKNMDGISDHFISLLQINLNDLNELQKHDVVLHALSIHQCIK